MQSCTVGTIGFHTFLSMLVQYTVLETISFSSSVCTQCAIQLILAEILGMTKENWGICCDLKKACVIIIVYLLEEEI